MSNALRKIMLEKSETFCMYPWVHLHTTPASVAAPCCIAQSCTTTTGVGDPRKSSLMELVNSEKMKQLRLDMLAGKKNDECTNCYRHEEKGIKSSRQYANSEWIHLFDNVMSHTNLEDGSLSKFEMKYFDIRFSNICNFKCRTCGAEFSTQWEQEDLKNNVSYAKNIPKNNSKEFLQDVIDQIEFMETAYFAGGEPLITEEHYILLEQMIRKNKTNIRLRYNTNLSNLKFKNKDLLKLWSYFTNDIDIYASIDHFGKRAEYIRHGTDWGVVETNFHTIKKQKNLVLQINTVLSAFNYLSIFEFYQYLIDNNMYSAKDRIYTLYCASTPFHIACHVLPTEFKEKGKQSVNKTIEYMKINAFQDYKIEQLERTHVWADSQNTWDQHGHYFKAEIERLDKIRGEKFESVFPELRGLINIDKRKFWPV